MAIDSQETSSIETIFDTQEMRSLIDFVSEEFNPPSQCEGDLDLDEVDDLLNALDNPRES